MRVLVTGGAGFIGSHTVDSLLARGDEVRILDNLQPPVHSSGKPAYVPDHAEFVIGDVRSRRALEYALQGVDAVFHFAAYQDYLPYFSRYFHVNAVSTALIYEVIIHRKLPVRKLIVASSQAVLGEGLHGCPAHGTTAPLIREDWQLREGRWEHLCPQCGGPMQYLPTPEEHPNPQNQYALSKHSEEMIAISLGKRYGLPSVALRYSIVQGARQSFQNAYSGAMRIFCQHLHTGLRPTIYEDGCQVRDYINIADVVAANLLVLDDARADYQIFNVGGGTPYTVSEFYQMVQDEVGIHLQPVHGAFYRYGDTRHILSDIGRLKALGWTPRRTIQGSIKEYWEYLTLVPGSKDRIVNAARRMKRLGVVREVSRQAEVDR